MQKLSVASSTDQGGGAAGLSPSCPALRWWPRSSTRIRCRSVSLIRGPVLECAWASRCFQIRAGTGSSCRPSSSWLGEGPLAVTDVSVGSRIEISFGPALPCDEDTLHWAKAACEMAKGKVYSGATSPFWYDVPNFFDANVSPGDTMVRELVAELDGCSGGKAGEIVDLILDLKASTRQAVFHDLERATKSKKADDQDAQMRGGFLLPRRARGSHAGAFSAPGYRGSSAPKWRSLASFLGGFTRFCGHCTDIELSVVSSMSEVG